MKSRIAISFLVLGAVLSSEAMAGDPVVGAIIGGGVGAAVGKSMGGRDGAVVGGMLGAMTGVIVATDRNGRREADYRVRYEDRGYREPDYRDQDYREYDRARIVYREAPRVIYRPAPVMLVEERAPRVVVYSRDWHPGRGYGWGHGHHQRWLGRQDYAYQDQDDRDD